MEKTLAFLHNTQNNRVYLQIFGENIWVTRPTAEQLQLLQEKILADVQVIRFKTPARTLYYVKCEDYSSLITAAQAVKILQAQGRINADDAAAIKKPADAEKLLSLRTVQQVPYWIDTCNAAGESVIPRTGEKPDFWVVKFKEHHVCRFKTRSEAQRAVKILGELGQPTVRDGVMTFQDSGFSLETLNWYDLNPCRAFVILREQLSRHHLPRTQFENACTALVPYRSLQPATEEQLAALAAAENADAEVAEFVEIAPKLLLPKNSLKKPSVPRKTKTKTPPQAQKTATKKPNQSKKQRGKQ